MTRLDQVVLAQERRMAIAALRAALRTGEDSAQAVVLRREPLVADRALIDVVRLGRSKPTKASHYVQTLGKDAIAEKVNLLVALGDASERSIAWLAAYLEEHPFVAGYGIRLASRLRVGEPVTVDFSQIENGRYGLVKLPGLVVRAEEGDPPKVWVRCGSFGTYAVPSATVTRGGGGER